MARGVNKVILIGNLGKDPETKSFSNGGSVTNVTMATSETWRDKEGNQQERTEWHTVVFHNKLGEIVGEYCRKGAKLYIEGSIRTRKYQKDGQDRYITEVHAHEMQMLDGKPASDRGEQRSSGYDRNERTERRQAANHGGGGGANRTGGAGGGGGFEDDDIPFGPRKYRGE